MSESVVSGFTSAGFDSYLSERKREVIDHDEQTLDGHVFLLHPIAHGVTGEVHVGGRLQERQCLILHLQRGDKAVTLVLKDKIGRSGKSVQYPETYVVSSAGIFVSDVAQSDNEIIHQE